MIPWSITEVVRYLFYTCNLTMKTVPYPIFYLRYSLFMVLYPAGITGEVFQMITSMRHWQESVPMWYLALILILIVYVPNSPNIILKMWKLSLARMKVRRARR